MSEIVFWGLLALLIYVYAGYPVVLYCLPARRLDLPEIPDGELPSVTLLISAYNEVECIAEKLNNSLSLDYPEDKLSVIVISDASDDGTDETVNAFGDDRVSLQRMDERGGKTLGLNAAMGAARSEIAVFSDANAMYEKDAIRRLVAPFSDGKVGAVIGESTYVEPDSDSGRSESLYWRYETMVKALESRSGSVVGGDGAIYAIKASLYRPMAAGDLSDFVNPLQVVRAGCRCLYEPSALSYEEAAESFQKEYRRKVRIVNRAWRAMWKMRSMLNPLRHGGFAIKLWSHKVLRWLVPVLLIAMLLINLTLVTSSPVYLVTLSAQLVFYACALIGYTNCHRSKQLTVFRVPYYFCLVNVAAAVGLAEVLLGKSYTTWTTARK
jgi:cellulose synthase/poly-beta-1,6-N-acetylglucosamine synthase-like glycosyltransferase